MGKTSQLDNRGEDKSICWLCKGSCLSCSTTATNLRTDLLAFHPSKAAKQMVNLNSEACEKAIIDKIARFIYEICGLLSLFWEKVCRIATELRRHGGALAYSMGCIWFISNKLCEFWPLKNVKALLCCSSSIIRINSEYLSFNLASPNFWGICFWKLQNKQVHGPQRSSV